VGLAAAISILLPKGNKWIALLMSSVAFYALLYSWQIIWLLVMSLITYLGARQIRKVPDSVVYFVPLLLFPLILEKATHLTPHYILGSQGVNWIAGKANITLIVGLSYFTFNAISYLVDVKRSYIQPEKSFPRLLFYLLFFPALLSGPLHRYKFISNQLKDIGWSLQSLSSGSVLLLWGFFKNMVVAQRLQYMLNGTEATGWFVLVHGLLFFLFLYVNFSSFIDIVQGIALLFNLQLKSNFHNRVYMAWSRQQFWQGWHITLNEWFRDYFFFSAARFDKKRRYTNLLLLLTFLLIALWHGFTLVLVVWGLLNGAWIIAEKKWMGRWQPETWWQKTAGILYHLGLASVLAALFITPSLGSLFNRFLGHDHLSLAKGGGYVLIVLIMAFGGMDWLNAKAADKRMDVYLLTLPYWQRTTLCGALLVAVFMFGLTNSITNYYIRF
jgi:alginate O-acetyltransferase complex protein AlgI